MDSSHDDIQYLRTGKIPTSAGGYMPHYVSASFYGPSDDNPLVLRDACKDHHDDEVDATICAKARNVRIVLFLEYVIDPPAADIIGRRSART